MECILATIHCHAHVRCLKHSPVRTICPCHKINGPGFLFPSSLVPSKYHALIHEQHVRLHTATTFEKISHFAEVLMSIWGRRTSESRCFSSQENFPSVSQWRHFDSVADRKPNERHEKLVVDFASKLASDSRCMWEHGALKVKHTFDSTFRTRLHTRQRMHIQNTLSICRFDNAQTLE